MSKLESNLILNGIGDEIGLIVGQSLWRSKWVCKSLDVEWSALESNDIVRLWEVKYVIVRIQLGKGIWICYLILSCDVEIRIGNEIIWDDDFEGLIVDFEWLKGKDRIKLEFLVNVKQRTKILVIRWSMVKVDSRRFEN